MSKRCIIVMLLVAIIFLPGCEPLLKQSRVETSTVPVKVVNAYHQNSYSQPVFIGKVFTAVHHDAINEITVEYNEVKYVISGEATYEKYKNRIGDTVNGTLETKYYDDGCIINKIVDLE